jgi:hypothetical protein
MDEAYGCVTQANGRIQSPGDSVDAFGMPEATVSIPSPEALESREQSL